MVHSHRISQSRGRFASATVVTALVAGGLLASLGAGYSVSRAALGDGSAYVAKGTTAAHVNAESGKIDAQTPGDLGTGHQGLQVVKLPNGQFVVVNATTSVVTTIDGATMKPTGTIPAEQAPGGVDSSADIRVITSGKSGWLVNASAGYVTLIGKNGPSGRQVKLNGALADAAPGPDGSVIVLTKDGVIVRVEPNLTSHRTPITDGKGGALTAASGRTFLITSGGDVLRVDGDQPRTLAKPAGLDAHVIAGSVQGAGQHVLAIEHDVLLLIDSSSGVTQNIAVHAGDATLGRPVELDGRVYIPDYSNHRLLVANEATGQLDKPIAVPGTTRTFALFVSGGRVWANDQFSQRMIAIDSDGVDHRIDKGTGKSVEDPDSKPVTPPKSTKPPKGTKPPPGTPIPNPNPGGHSTPIPNPVTTRPTTPTTPVLPNPGTAPPKLVTVPNFGINTDYHDACAQLETLQVRCAAVAVGDNGQSGNTDDVVDTKPGAGTKVAVGSQVIVTYLGQLVVPDQLTGATPYDACAKVKAAYFKCDPQPTATPASSSTDFGIVNAANPASGSKVNKGTTVTVSYPDTFTMPDFRNQAGSAACTQLAAYVLNVNGTATSPKCTAAVGNTAPTAPQAGQVYQQTPAALAPTSATTAVTLTVYNGNVTVPNWTGQDANAALAACQATPGLTCQPLVAGDSAANQPARAGQVETQSPAAGTYPVVATVTITFWRGDNVVPNVTNGDKDAGCTAIQAAGFQCGDAPGLVGPTFHLVVSQDQAAGSTLPLGSTITYHYSPYQADDLWIYRANNNDPVWAMRFAAAGPPAGYGANPAQNFHVGYAYQPGTVAGWPTVNGYFCTGGPSRCEGYDSNHFYSTFSDPYSSGGVPWNGPNAMAQFMPGPCPAGALVIYRWWVFGATHQYGLGAQVPAGVTGQEPLGCVWS